MKATIKAEVTIEQGKVIDVHVSIPWGIPIELAYKIENLIKKEINEG